MTQRYSDLIFAAAVAFLIPFAIGMAGDLVVYTASALGVWK